MSCQVCGHVSAGCSRVGSHSAMPLQYNEHCLNTVLYGTYSAHLPYHQTLLLACERIHGRHHAYPVTMQAVARHTVFTFWCHYVHPIYGMLLCIHVIL